ncbi:MAG: cytochrome ubiquinol oxidase subunit I [Acidovorax sp.]|jgi:cytochrome d ubiquinol oxidase subunit I|nr:cytochrome ubiquinol oxidase subunit I [Acidovorax sp.]
MFHLADIGALDLARVQFAFTVSFHIVFPSITIGLASYLAVLEGLWLLTRREVYKDLFHYWVKFFSLCFGMGVVSGLVMAYQFGTNWSGFSNFAGSITGPLLTYEVLTAFFLEAGFLGVMLFGWNKVGPRLHFFATLMVALGTLISATWILASNSWMQTPVGYDIVDGRVVPTDWLAIVFNPSFPYRLAHMVVAAFLSTALIVGGTGAWHLLRGRRTAAVQRMTSMALWMVLAAAPLQALIGDQHGLNTLKHQPAKLAAMEAHWEHLPEGEGVPLVLFALPDQEAQTNRYALEIPRLASLVLTHSWDGEIPALKDFPKEDLPPVATVFWSFRVMVGLGMLMLLMGLCGLWLRWRGRLYAAPWFQRFCVAMGPSGLVALLAGWFVTETGRQPWVVYGVMRTADSVSNHDFSHLAVSLAVLVVVYLLVFGTGTWMGLKMLAQAPHEGEQPPEGGPGEPNQPMRPISGANPSASGQAL